MLLLIVMVPVVLAAAVGGLWPLLHRSTVLGGVTTIAVSVLVITGMVLVGEPTQRRVGLGLVAAGALLVLSWVNEWGAGPLPVLSLLEGHGWLVLSGWALYRYPGPPLPVAERRCFVVMAAWAVAWPWAVVLTARPDWLDYPASSWWPSLWANRTASAVTGAALAASDVAVLGLYLLLWMRRLRSATPARRRTVLPGAAAAAVGVGSASLVPLAALARLPHRVVEAGDGIATVGMLAIPGALLVAVVRRYLDRARLTSLLMDLRSTHAEADAVRALRRALEDDGLLVGVWSPGRQAYLDDAGRAVDPPSDGTYLVSTPAASTGEPLALVAGDATTHADPELFGAACAAFGLSLENARLLEAADRRLADLRAATAQALTAARSERRRMEQDLHDGAQARFLALAPLIGAAQARTDDPATSQALEEIKTELRGALRELRRLARGEGVSAPAGGLAEAVRDLAAVCAVPLVVDLPATALPPEVEGTAYLVICEAVANAIRHSRAAAVSVTGHVDAGRLTVSVRDDGRGGAAPGAGRGLPGMSERAAAAGGSLVVTSPDGGGTTVTLDLPCG